MNNELSREELLALMKEANSNIKTTDIKGKDYCDVPERVKAFRNIYPTGLIDTTLVNMSGEIGSRVVMFKCEVYDDKLTKLSTGYAEEKENSTFINKTSFVENCETSAIGRALGFAGIGLTSSIASAEEVSNAMANQNKKVEPKKEVNPIEWLKQNLDVVQVARYLEHYKIETLDDMEIELAQKIMEGIKGKKNENNK